MKRPTLNRRERRDLNWMMGMILVAVFVGGGVLHLAQEKGVAPKPKTVRAEAVTVEPPTGYDWRRIARRNGYRFGICHQNLVRAQDRLRRLGHRYSERAGGWVRASR